MSFPARHKGSCTECWEPINVGDFVEYNDKGGLVHTECPELERPEKEPCPDCFLIHAGECF